VKDTGVLQGVGSVAAVVVTYNRLAKLKATLKRLLATPPHQLSQIVVVNNASNDGTAAWLATVEDPRLVVHHANRNMGGAGGFSAGIRRAVETSDPDWVVVMDDDARPLDGAFERFHERPRGHREAWAAAVFYPSGHLCEMNRPTRNPFWNPRAFLGAVTRGRRGFHIDDEEFHGSQQVPIDVASFVGLFLSRKAIRMIGYPDASIFIYGDDVLYSLDLRRAGGRIEFDPDLRFEHDCESSKPGKKVYHATWRSYYHHRNLLLVYRKAAGPLFWPVVMLIVPRWLAMSAHYGTEAGAYRVLLKRAIRDGIRRDTSTSHEEVLQLAADARNVSAAAAA
jgi:GT2 family glycosyltransferase